MGKLTQDNRKSVFVIIALVLVGIGFTLLVTQGLFRLGEADQLDKSQPLKIQSEMVCEKRIRCFAGSVSSTFMGNNNEAFSLVTFFNFTTLEVFAEDNIMNFTFETSVIGSQKIDEVYYFIQVKKSNFTNIYQHQPEDLIKQADEGDRLIDMYKINDTYFMRTGTFESPFEDEIAFFGLFKNDAGWGLIDQTSGLFPINPHGTLLQAIANRKLIESIEATEITNLIVEGLTWIGIAVVPILIGSEILVRVYLDRRNSQDDD